MWRWGEGGGRWRGSRSGLRRRAAAPRGLGAFLLRERHLAQADIAGRHLDALVLTDELERLLEQERPLGDQARELLRVRLAHVGELLLLRRVHLDVLGSRALDRAHALVGVLARADEHRPALLEREERERRAHALAVGDERTGRAGAKL